MVFTFPSTQTGSHTANQWLHWKPVRDQLLHETYMNQQAGLTSLQTEGKANFNFA